MPQPNYSLKLTLTQANIVRRALQSRKQELEKLIPPMHPDDGKALRDEYSEVEKLLMDI